MKNNKWAKYFIYIVLAYALLAGGNAVYRYIDIRRGITYDSGLTQYLAALVLIFHGAIGSVLGCEHLIRERRKEGAWRADWPKLLIMGLPAWVFSSPYLLVNLRNPFIALYQFIGRTAENYWDMTRIFSLVLGYIIITSFYKREVD